MKEQPKFKETRGIAAPPRNADAVRVAKKKLKKPTF
jgi:hypothetical protein